MCATLALSKTSSGSQSSWFRSFGNHGDLELVVTILLAAVVVDFEQLDSVFTLVDSLHTQSWHKVSQMGRCSN